MNTPAPPQASISVWRRVLRAALQLLAQPLIWLVKLYRLTLSPFVGQHCRFTPTCSVYAIEALQAHGALKGSYLAAKRLGRCHPWCEGGYDPVPPANGQPHDHNTPH
jgi:putative membrane protein insertion efficiency factor